MARSGLIELRPYSLNGEALPRRSLLGCSRLGVCPQLKMSQAIGGHRIIGGTAIFRPLPGAAFVSTLIAIAVYMIASFVAGVGRRAVRHRAGGGKLGWGLRAGALTARLAPLAGKGCPAARDPGLHRRNFCVPSFSSLNTFDT